MPNFARQNAKSSVVEKKPGFLAKNDRKSKEEKDYSVAKQRPSQVQMPHPASFSTLYQLHQMQNGLAMPNGTVSKRAEFQRQHSQPENYYMWHAKSYESGISKWTRKYRLTCLINFILSDGDSETPYPIYGRLPAQAGRGYVPRSKVYVGEWE